MAAVNTFCHADMLTCSPKQMMLAGEEIAKAACADHSDAEVADMEELDKVVDKKLDCLRDLLIDADKLR